MNRSSEVQDESDIISAILAGNVELYHELIRPYEYGVYIIAFSYVMTESEAEDIARTVFIEAYRLSTFGLPPDFSTWLFSITLDEALRRRMAVLFPHGRQGASEVVPREEVRVSLCTLVDALRRHGLRV
jgi:hypothetical protein